MFSRFNEAAKYGILVAIVATVGGCFADDPPHAIFDSSVDINLPDQPTGCPPTPLLGAPTIDNNYPNPTNNLTQPFRGSAAGAARLIASGARGIEPPVTVAADGRFCVEVGLFPDAATTVEFTPVTADGCFGQKTQLTINHQTSTVDAGIPTGPANVAKFQPVESESAPDINAVTMINDGDPATWAEFSFNDAEVTPGNCDNGAHWLQIDLGKLYTITKVRIRWANPHNGKFATCYDVLFSSAQSRPVDPDSTPVPSGSWRRVLDIDGAGAADQDLTVDPQTARWVAVLLRENDNTGLFEEQFKVAEIEVIGTDPNGPINPNPDTCP